MSDTPPVKRRRRTKGPPDDNVSVWPRRIRTVNGVTGATINDTQWQSHQRVAELWRFVCASKPGVYCDLVAGQRNLCLHARLCDELAGCVSGEVIEVQVLWKPQRPSKKMGKAFAALKTDGSVLTWGDSSSGGDSTRVAGRLASGVARIIAGSCGFAAIKHDGSVVTWGEFVCEPECVLSPENVARQLEGEVVDIVATTSFDLLGECGDYNAFAALKSSGSVVTWGYCGAAEMGQAAPRLSGGVQQVVASGWDFLALKRDGSIVQWGVGDGTNPRPTVSTMLASGVIKVVATPACSHGAFADLKDDGSVVSWGQGRDGVIVDSADGVVPGLSSGGCDIIAADYAFAAIKANGSVVTWGTPSRGGDSQAVATQLTGGVVHVVSNSVAFAAIKETGSVVTWGHGESGGDSRAVSNKLASGIIHVSAAARAFAAVTRDGEVVAWGDKRGGGQVGRTAASRLSSGVLHVVAGIGTFAALKQDGDVVTWGLNYNLGMTRTVASQLSSGVRSIFAAGMAFAAIKLSIPRRSPKPDSELGVRELGADKHNYAADALDQQCSQGIDVLGAAAAQQHFQCLRAENSGRF